MKKHLDLLLLLLVLLFTTLHILLLPASSSATASPLYKRNIRSSTDTRLEIFHHHVGREDSSSPSPQLPQILARDQQRADSLRHRIIGSNNNKTQYYSPLSHGPDSTKSSSSIPLTSGLSIGSGNYYVKLGIGSPAKHYAMLMDTGSSLSWLQCKPCVIYCHSQVDPVFDPSASSTYSKLSCGTPECSSLKASTLNDPACADSNASCIYTASYGDASYSIGYLSKDVISTNLSPAPGSQQHRRLQYFTFGCGQDNEGLFGRAAGILGLARGKLSFLSQLPSSNGFSYCLPTATSTPSSSGGGYLSLGSSAFSSLPYKFTPMLTDPKNPSLYFLDLTAITVSGKPLPVSPDSYRVPTILDSGTVITRIPAAAYRALQGAVVKAVSWKFAQAPAYSILETCFKGKVEEMAAVVPRVGLVFRGGARLDLVARNLLVEVSEEGISCLGFASSPTIAIIANRQQQTVNVAYDVGKSRIGFAPGGCR